MKTAGPDSLLLYWALSTCRGSVPGPHHGYQIPWIIEFAKGKCCNTITSLGDAPDPPEVTSSLWNSSEGIQDVPGNHFQFTPVTSSFCNWTCACFDTFWYPVFKNLFPNFIFFFPTNLPHITPILSNMFSFFPVLSLVFSSVQSLLWFWFIGFSLYPIFFCLSLNLLSQPLVPNLLPFTFSLSILFPFIWFSILF